MPKYKAPKQSWELIADKLNKKKRKETHFLFFKVAATAVILIGFGFYLASVYTTKNKYEISYSVELESEQLTLLSSELLSSKSESNEIIIENCKLSPEICKSDVYLELKKQLEELEIEEKYLKEQLALYNDPQIENFLLRITNEKLRVEKFILNIFNIN